MTYARRFFWVIGVRFTAAALVIGLCTAGMSSVPAAASVQTLAREAYLVDYETGTVLYEKNGNIPMPPSSMSKLMTTVMVFERLKEGSLSLDDRFSVSRNAWRKGGAASGGSTMFLKPGSTVSVEDLLYGVIVQSGNDACIVLAENLSGTEDAFAREMNAKAKGMGLSGSHFVNSTGLPDEGHVMTARDLALLSRYIIHTYPEFYPIFSATKFAYNGIRQQNRNPLLYAPGQADGLKTGHTSVAGYGLTASAEREGRRLILVVNGLDSKKTRAAEAKKLMNWGFSQFENRTLFVAGAPVSQADVWLGQSEHVPLTVMHNVRVTLPRRALNRLDVRAVFTGPVPAPVAKGQHIGTLVVTAPGMHNSVDVPLVAAQDIARLGIWGRVYATIDHMLFGTRQRSDPPAVSLPSAEG